jgi:tetratricopeptide (TPR) repeat protein
MTGVRAKTPSVPEVEKRLAEVEETLKKDPRNIKALESKIAGLNLLGRTQEAEAICDQALRLSSDRGFLWFFKGYCKFRKGCWKESIPLFERGYKFGNISSLGMKALGLRKLNKFSECIEFTTNYIKQYPDMYELYYNRGLARRALNESRELVCADLKKAADLDAVVSNSYRSICLDGD